MAQSKNSVTMCISYKERISWINIFDGKIDNYKNFIVECDNAFEGADEETSHSILNYLRKILNNTQISTCISNHSFTTWTELKNFLDTYFGVHLEPCEIKWKILSIHRIESESTFLFYNRCLGLLNDYKLALNDHYNNKIKIEYLFDEAEEIAMKRFISGMNDQ